MAYWVYVIELASTVWERGRFRAQNPNFEVANPPDRFFYVGQTALSPKDRFEKHRSGVRASSIVRDFGKYVRTKMCRSYDTREEALEMEHAYATRIRKKGSAAYSN